MKMLVVGGRGMAGHMLIRYFGGRDGVQVMYTTRDKEDGDGYLLELMDFDSIRELIARVRPDVIVNAAGILNQDAEQHPLQAYQINGLLPHWLRHLADENGARLIHISSDCVFSGTRGGYREDDVPDGTTVYARTKALGEVRDPRHLTIRTSIIGPEIREGGIGLLQWFMRQKGSVSGYARVLWNGVTTLELAKAADYALQRPGIGGLVHLTAGETVSKLELLRLFQSRFGPADLDIVPDDRIMIDRTLAVTREDWQYEASGYEAMLNELVNWMRAG